MWGWFLLLTWLGIVPLLLTITVIGVLRQFIPLHRWRKTLVMLFATAAMIIGFTMENFSTAHATLSSYYLGLFLPSHRCSSPYEYRPQTLVEQCLAEQHALYEYHMNTEANRFWFWMMIPPRFRADCETISEGVCRVIQAHHDSILTEWFLAATAHGVIEACGIGIVVWRMTRERKTRYDCSVGDLGITNTQFAPP